MKPTEAQIKEFWEWCGFKQLEWGRSGWHYERTQKAMNWIHPLLEYGSLEFLPRIDLNNLFKYAVPKLGLIAIDIRRAIEPKWEVILSLLDKPPSYSRDNDPALALFWALWQVSNQ